MAQSINIYVAPITLGFTPADGDLIRGTVNGVEVSGEWIFNGVMLYDSAKNQICTVGFNGPQSALVVRLPSALTTDYELHLYRYTPEGIVQIPQRYVDGLEETTANANQALETATAAQSTAEAAQSAASNTKPIVIEAEANASNGTVNLTADGISKMNTLDSRYENGNPCPAYLHYAVNGENVYTALIFSQLRNYYFRNDYTVSIYVAPDTKNGWKLITEPKT